MRSKAGPRVVAIVGAGRVGSALGRLLRRKGWRIGPVVTRSMRTGHVARQRIGSGQPQVGFSQALLTADVVLIATPDRAIAQTAEALARIAGSKAWQRKNRPAHERGVEQRCSRAAGASRRRNGFPASAADLQWPHNSFIRRLHFYNRRNSRCATHGAPDQPRTGLCSRGAPIASESRISCRRGLVGWARSRCGRSGSAHSRESGLSPAACDSRPFAAHAANPREFRARRPSRCVDGPLESRRFCRN